MSTLTLIKPPAGPYTTAPIAARHLMVGLWIQAEFVDSTLPAGIRVETLAEIARIDRTDRTVTFWCGDTLHASFERDAKVRVAMFGEEPKWCTNHTVNQVDCDVEHQTDQLSLILDDAVSGAAVDVNVSAYRFDDADGDHEREAHLSIWFGDRDGLDIPVTAGREFAALILQTVNAVEGSPNFVEVEAVKLDDEIHVGDEWQTVTVLVHDGRRSEVAVYTVSDEDAALRVPLGTVVEVRHSADLVYATDTKFDTKEVGQDGSQ